ncbi:MAG: MlaD family protein [Planctomycetota bacterium]|nr:MlaD family protein [Planctomycetota bacterium]
MSNGTGYSNAEVKAGVFLTICLAMFVAMLFIYGKVARVWRGRQEISVVFTSVTSLRPDAPVRYNGVEVGRVKETSILHLNDAGIARLPPFAVKDLENLPLTEHEQKVLRNPALTPPNDFQDEVARKLQQRTMILLKLEVMQEGDVGRYRVDDEVHISTTLMGDTFVEIASGSGEALNPKDPRLMLGRSGDFFSNLAKSVEQVKEILASVSDLVGPDERDSVRKALRRFDSITDRIEKIVTLADTRLPTTWNKVDDLADNAKSNITRIGDTVTGIQPQITRTLATADEAVKDVQGRVGTLADEAKATVVEVRGQLKPIFGDVQHITSKTKDDLPALIKNAKDLAVRLQESAGKLDTVLVTGNRLLNESYPDLRRLVLAFRLGAENFEEATNLLKRKPWLIYNPAKESETYTNAQKMARDLEVATKRFAELSSELQAIQRNLQQAPPADGAVSPATKDQMERINFIIQELNVLSDMLKFAGDVTRKEVLAPIERKKTGFIPVVEEFDPTLGRKKSDK